MWRQRGGSAGRGGQPRSSRSPRRRSRRGAPAPSPRARRRRPAARRCRRRSPAAVHRALPDAQLRTTGSSPTTITLRAFSRPWEIPAARSSSTWRQSCPSSSSLTVSGGRSSSGSDVGLARDDECVAVRAQSGGRDSRRRDSGLRSHQGGQCLMLDLFQPADRRAARRVAEGERAVSPRPPLGVLCIPAEDAHLQRLAGLGRADVLRRADPLARRDPELANADAQLDQRPAHGVRGRHPFGRAERDADENARRQAQRDAAQGARRKRRADDDGAEPGERRQARRPASVPVRPARDRRP